MRYLLVTPLLFLAALVQASVLPSVRVLGIMPNLILVFVVAWAMIRGPDDAVPAVVLGGLSLGLFSAQPLGLAILALLPIVPLATLRDLHLLQSNFLLTVPVLIVATLLYFCVMLIGLALVGDGVPPLLAARRLLFPTLVGNSLALALLYPFMARFAAPASQPGPLWGRNYRLQG